MFICFKRKHQGSTCQKVSKSFVINIYKINPKTVNSCSPQFQVRGSILSVSRAESEISILYGLWLPYVLMSLPWLMVINSATGL